MGEHLVPQGFWRLSAMAGWHKRRHIINFIISPGIVSVGASIFFYPVCRLYIIWGLWYISVSCLGAPPPPPSCGYHYSSYDCTSPSMYVFFASYATERRSCHWQHMFVPTGHVTGRNPARGTECMSCSSNRQWATMAEHILMRSWLVAGKHMMEWWGCWFVCAAIKCKRWQDFK